MREFIDKLIVTLENEMRYCQFKTEKARKKKHQNLITEEKLGYKQAQCFDASIQIVKALAKAYCNDGWIPCEERLPEEYTEVLGCDYDGNITVVELYKDSIFGEVWRQWNGGCIRLGVIIAWQPLPQPYVKGEQHE